ncbi:MAG: hypothetical protein HQM10_08140 [Candidatus Riflebacteria bacterium]|nr:hypothetical protein [Candidatus Riflebacteria bacterium]
MRKDDFKEFHGVTLVELLFAASILILLTLPIFRILSSGMQSSLYGMLQIETTSEARRILKQIHSDLKFITYRISSIDETVNVKPEQLIRWTSASSLPQVSYHFNSFSTKGEINDVINLPASSNDPARVYTSRITYSVVPNNDPTRPFFQLVRKEKFHPDSPLSKQFPNGVWEHVLSKRVNTFQIKLVSFEDQDKDKQYFFLVVLQLVDSLKSNFSASIVPGDQLKGKQTGVILADFHDVVFSDAFTLYWQNSSIVRNWYNIVEGEDLSLIPGVDLTE